MTPKPTGRLLSTKEGRDLVLTRSFRAPIEDVWASITESERTGRWFASWTGEPGPGQPIRATLEFEEGKPETDMTIDACEPPRHVAVSSHDVYGTWRLDATLVERDGVTELTFVQHLDDGVGIGEVGPGWEYYLDRLVFSREAGTSEPTFDDYYPSQKTYFEQLTPTTAPPPEPG